MQWGILVNGVVWGHWLFRGKGTLPLRDQCPFPLEVFFATVHGVGGYSNVAAELGAPGFGVLVFFQRRVEVMAGVSRVWVV